MPNFTLTLEVSANYITDIPTLEIVLDGGVVSSDAITAQTGTGTISLSYNLSFTGSNPTSLEFRFNDALAEVSRSIRIEDIRINNNGVSVSQMTLAGGSSLGGGEITLNANGDSTALNMTTQGFLFGLSETEPTIADFDPVTINGTASRDNMTGTAGDDVIDAQADDDAVRAGAGNDQIHGGDGADKLFGEAGDDLIAGGDGNDRIYGGAGADTIYGGLGNDAVVGEDGDDVILGNEGNDRLHGDDGNDSLFGGSGADRLDGDVGNDYIDGGADDDKLYGSEGDDTIVGGAGRDFIYGDADNDNLNGDEGNDYINGGTGNDIIDGGANNDTLYGGAGIDTINGGTGNDTVYGGDDNDTINGGTGNDKLIGDAGDDIINGGEGSDKILGGIGIDTIDGGDGNDILIGNDGDDTIYGGAGTRDELYGGAGADTLHGEAGFNKFFGGNGNDTMYGDSDVDVIRGDNGDDTGYGYDGDDILVGGAGNDTMYGGNNNDILRGNDDNDDLYGDAGDDELNGGAGNDTIDGGADTDIAVYTSATTGGVTVDLSIQGVAQDTINAGLDTLVDIENLRGSLFADTLTGDTGVNEIYGQDGDDVIVGDDGADRLDGDVGNDIIFGGNGMSVQTTPLLSYGGGQDAGGTVTQFTGGVTLDGNLWKKILVNYTVTANTVIEFDFRSTLEAEISGIGFDNDDGIDSNATFKVYGDQNWGRTNFDNYDGSGEWTHYTIEVGSFYTGTFSHLFLVNDDDGGGTDGNSTFANIVIYESDVVSDNDTINGGDNDDQLFGGSGDDIINGDDGNDILSGNEGNDTLNGGAGNDILRGGAGVDILNGGAGADEIYSGSDSTAWDAAIANLLASNAGISYSAETNSFYQYVTTTANWNAADAAANAATLTGLTGNGYLAVITSQAENDYIFSIAGGNRLWIGGSDASSEGTWSWTNTSSADEAGLQFHSGGAAGSATNGLYTNWVAGDPSNGNAAWDYTEYRADGTWWSNAETSNFGYIIEWDADTLLATADRTTLSGGDDGDTLYASGGLDIFDFDNTTGGTDIIENFSTTGRDAIDISDILTGYDFLTSNINDFVQLTEAGGNTTISVDADGVGGYTDIATLNGVTGLDLYQMIGADNLIV